MWEGGNSPPSILGVPTFGTVLEVSERRKGGTGGDPVGGSRAPDRFVKLAVTVDGGSGR